MFQKLYDEAVELFNAKNYEAAIPKLKEVLSIDENTIEAWKLLGHCFFLLQDYDNAALSYKRTIALDPQNTEYIKFLAESYFWGEYYEDALAMYEQIISLDPKNNNALLYAAKCNLFLGDNNEALKKLKQTSNLTKEEKESKDETQAVILAYKAYGVWSVYDDDGNRFPTSRRQYKKAKKIIDKAAAIGTKGDWAKGELKWMKGMLKHSKKRIFAGSYLIIILTLIFVFFTTGGIKGCSWEKHKAKISAESAFVGKVASTSFSSLLKNGNFSGTTKLFNDEEFMENANETVNGFYLIGSTWLIFLILYLVSARIPLYLSEKRLKNHGKFTNAITSGMESLQRTDTRWKTTWSDGSTTYSDDYSGTVASLILAGVSIILTLLLLPLTVILNFLRNYVFYI